MIDTINKSYDHAFGIMLFLLPFSNAAPNFFLALLLVILVFNVKNFNWSSVHKFNYLFLFLGYILLKAYLTNTIFLEWSIYKKYLIILILPILCGKIVNISVIKVYALIGISLSILVSGFNILVYYYKYALLPFSNGSLANTFLLAERPYMGMLAVLNVLLSLNLINYYRSFKILLVAVSLLSIGFILLISARLSFVTLIILGLVYTFFYFKSKIITKISLVCVILITISLLISLNKNMRERFFIYNNFEQSLELASNYEPRINIWKCGFDIIKSNDNLVFGYNSNDAVSQLFKQCYSLSIENRSKRAWFVNVNFNSHNQFLDIILTQGIFGLILFLSFIFYSLYIVKHNYYKLAILLSFVMFLFVENIFNRQLGCYLFGVFFSIPILRLSHEEN